MPVYEGPPVVVEQSLGVAGQFDGSAPSAEPASEGNGVRIYPAETGVAGGRFKWGDKFEAGTPPVSREHEFGGPVGYNVVERVVWDFLALPGGSTWQIEIVSAAGKRVVWISGALDVGVYSGDDTELVLAPDEWLELSTSAAVAVGACWIRIWARRYGVWGK